MKKKKIVDGLGMHYRNDDDFDFNPIKQLRREKDLKENSWATFTLIIVSICLNYIFNVLFFSLPFSSPLNKRGCIHNPCMKTY